MLHACFQTTFGLKFRCFGGLRLRLALAELTGRCCSIDILLISYLYKPKRLLPMDEIKT